MTDKQKYRKEEHNDRRIERQKDERTKGQNDKNRITEGEHGTLKYC